MCSKHICIFEYLYIQILNLYLIIYNNLYYYIFYIIIYILYYLYFVYIIYIPYIYFLNIKLYFLF